MERIELKEIKEDLTGIVLDNDGNQINIFNPDELELSDTYHLTDTYCNTVEHITFLGVKITDNDDNKNVIHVFFLFKFKSREFNIVEVQYRFDKNPDLEKIIRESIYAKLTFETVLDSIIDSYDGKITKIDMKFKEYDNGTDLLVLPCIDDEINYKALFINKRQLAQLAFVENYFLYLNMDNRVLYNILKNNLKDDGNIFDYTVTFVNNIEKVAKAGKHTVACVSSFECVLDDQILDIHTLSSHNCERRIKRSKINSKVEDIVDKFGKSRREFIVDYMANVIINDQDNLLIKAKNMAMGDVIIRLDKYTKDDFMKLLGDITNIK